MRSQLCIALFASAAAATLATDALGQGRGGGGGAGGGGRGAAAQAPTVGAVTVTAAPNAFRGTIDSRSYSIADDLQTTSGSIADALKNVPSLEVDVQGNVSLRGDTSVTILIDGKPSGAFRGEGRADALQQMAADQIERVEVITNPSAAYDPEGGGGVINLITKKGRGAGGSGSVRANVGDMGRANGALSGSYNSNKLTVSGDTGFRKQNNKGESSDQRTQISGAGVQTQREQDGQTSQQNQSRNLRLNADYDPSKATRIGVEARHNSGENNSTSLDTYRGADAAGTPLSLSDRVGATRGERSSTDLSASYRHSFGEGHEIVVDASMSKEANSRDRQYLNRSQLPPAADILERFRDSSDEAQDELKIDYSRPLGAASLKAGYDLETEDNGYDNFGASGASSGSLTPDPRYTNRFRFQQTINAAYATYERALGDFTFQGGLRAEHVAIDVNQITSTQRENHDYTRLYPSLHLGYQLDDDQQLTASYSHRVRRPRPEDLNPYPVYQDPYNVRAGNPFLEPQETHSLEAGYQYRRSGGYYLATAFYRQSYNGISDVVRDIGGGVLLTTRANISESRSGGLELVANGKLTPKLAYSLNGSVYWSELQALAVSNERRSGAAVNGRANLNWTPTANDLLQISAVANGKRLTAQGYNEPNTIVNLGYRHKINNRLTLMATAQDLFDTARFRTVVDTPTLKQTVERKPNFRSVFVGFTYSFGAATRRREGENFEFEGSAAAPETP